MLKDKVIEALMGEFGDQVRVDATAKDFAIIDAKHQDVGSLFIEEDHGELIVSIEKITHGHFGSYDNELTKEEQEAEIVRNLMEFLKELLTDRCLLFTTWYGGGWLRCEAAEETGRLSRRRRWFTWSGPVDV